MNKLTLLVAGLAATAFISGCSSPKKEVVADCVFPDATEKAAPGWICAFPPRPGTPLSPPRGRLLRGGIGRAGNGVTNVSFWLWS